MESQLFSQLFSPWQLFEQSFSVVSLDSCFLFDVNHSVFFFFPSSV